MGQQTSRQEVISTEINDPLVRNWLCLNLAIKETSQTLAVCAHKLISNLHKEMQKSTSSTPLCKRNCSQRDGNWCVTCDRWKKEILGICEPEFQSRICWRRLNSAQWDINPYETCRALIPKAHRLYYKSVEFHEDLRFTLSFIENCSRVTVPRTLCEKAWRCRGRARRKGTSMHVSSKELEDTVSVLVQLLSVPEFGDMSKSIQKLQSLTMMQEELKTGCVVM